MHPLVTYAVIGLRPIEQAPDLPVRRQTLERASAEAWRGARTARARRTAGDGRDRASSAAAVVGRVLSALEDLLAPQRHTPSGGLRLEAARPVEAR